MLIKGYFDYQHHSITRSWNELTLSVYCTDYYRSELLEDSVVSAHLRPPPDLSDFGERDPNFDRFGRRLSIQSCLPGGSQTSVNLSVSYDAPTMCLVRSKTD
jgi:hypothetical protein